MNDPVAGLDAWLRGEFVRINTELENAYFSERVDVITGRPALDTLKLNLLREGGLRMEALRAVDTARMQPEARYALLGMVGFYLAACRRHEAALGDAMGGQEAAWTVAMQIGGSLSVVPRFVFAHQALFNEAVGGRYHTFTALRDEQTWIEFNTLAVLAYRRAADALREVTRMGPSNPVAAYPLEHAHAALGDVLRFNRELSDQLDVERFYFSIRPYFKSHPVGHADYRGANASDFAAVNEIDVALGLCSMRDPFYQGVVHQKLGHVPPGDQRALRDLGRRPSLLLEFCGELDRHGATPQWRANAARLLDVCKAHAGAYAFHHQRLVKPFLVQPAGRAASAHSAGITSSGPPLQEVVAMLERLLALRAARDTRGGNQAGEAIAHIRAALAQP